MAGGESEKEEEWPAARLADAPLLFFVATHKAFRAELASIHHAAAEAASSCPKARREITVVLGRRLDFLRLVYNYHSAAEDEVIFVAFDALVKNVVSTYELEHKFVDDKFNSVFNHLDLLMKKEHDDPQMFRELLFSIGTIRTTLNQHMHKEEQQIFSPLLRKFTPAEQSKLVWQYMCRVPVILLEEFLPWMTLILTTEEKQDVLDCVKLIIPKDRKLQEVVISWIQHEERSSETYKLCQLLNGLSGFKDIHKLYPPQISCKQKEQHKKASSVQISDVETPIKGIYLWHAALRRDFDQVIEELYRIRSSNCCSGLSSVILQIKFITDVLIFYSNSLDKFAYPLLSVLSKNTTSLCSPLIDEIYIKGFQRLLYYEHQGSAQLKNFVEMLCQELETLVRGLGKNLIFLETEVLTSISEICTSEMQLWLMYTTLHTMPLGLLRCTVTWFSAHLNDNQSNSILKNIKLGFPSINDSFTSLLHEWVRIGSSGKISIDKFRQDLQEMFDGRSFYLVKENGQNTVTSSHLLKTMSAITMKKSVATTSSSDSIPIENHGISYPSGMNLHKFFSQMFKRKATLQKNFAKYNHATFLALESKPMDIVFYIHRALIKDMEYLVSLSSKLVENFGLLAEFKSRFELLSKFFQLHSNSEDEICFPALESKGALQNISQSYCIDHQLETIQFRKIYVILNHISELHDRPKQYQLCLRLHDTCVSMHQVLSDHIHREEIEIFPLFRRYFSTEEEEKFVGHMLGVMRAEILQEMIPWLMAYLNLKEQNSVISLWLKVTRYTKFDEWLREWWEGMKSYNSNETEEKSIPSPSLAAADPLEVVSRYLSNDGTQAQKGDHSWTRKENKFSDLKLSGSRDVDESTFVCGAQDLSQNQSEVEKILSEVDEKCQHCQKLSLREHPLCMNQEDLEAMIRRVSRDSNLVLQDKSYIIQNLLMSRWTIAQKISQEKICGAILKDEIPGQSPSYQDPLKLTFGCEHYKRNCKLLAPCCNKLYTCIRCHDDLTDHSVDRKSITEMMCMKCLVLQPMGSQCISDSCNGFSMGRYYCRICKLFDDGDGRQIYHCPYCNLCRVGKGLGIDYFHCMKCNACMSRSLFVHVCREKCLEDNCPICHEYIFTSNSPVKALPCGHLMHSSCFKDYTFFHYVCPICSKSLGDMQVYFGMLDALLAEEKTPEQTTEMQVILCNDCEKRGNASFHWLYHKCPHCSSFNTRLI